MLINPETLKEFQFTLDTEFAKAQEEAIPAEKSLADVLFYEKTALNRKSVKYPWLTGSPRIVKLGKGDPQEKQQLSMNMLTVEAGRASLLLGIDEFDLECDEEGLYIDFVRDAGSQQADYYELRAAQLFTGGFTTQTADGQAKYFFDTGRKVDPAMGAASATYDNKITDALGATGYAKARKMLMQMTDAKGKPVGYGTRGYGLICGPENESAALNLLKAVNNSNGATNVYASEATRLVISPYLGTSTAWGLVALSAKSQGRAMIKQINAPWRSRMTGTDSTNAIINGEILYQTHMRGEETYGDPRRMVGSTGAGA